MFISRLTGPRSGFKLLSIHNTNSFFCTEDGTLWVLTNDNSAMSYDVLMKYRIGPEDKKKEVLSKFRAVLFFGDRDNNLWFLGKADDSNDIVIVKRTPDGSYKTIKTFRNSGKLSPVSIYFYKRKIDVLFSDMNLLKNGKDDIFPYNGYSKRFMRSEDLGESWNEEKLPNEFRTEPFGFYKDDKVWMYGGGDNIQVRETKKE